MNEGNISEDSTRMRKRSGIGNAKGLEKKG